MLSIYQQGCLNCKVKPNSAISELCNDNNASLRVLDMSRNFVGCGNGFEALTVLLEATRDTLEELNLSHTALTTENVKSLCKWMQRAPALRAVYMHNCSLYLEAAQALLTTLRLNQRIVVLGLTSEEDLPNPNMFPQSWLVRFDLQLQRNQEKSRP